MNQIFKNAFLRAVLPLCLLFLGFSAVAQTWTIGTGVTSNTTTTYPTPFGSFYWGNRVQFLYRAVELQAAGMTAGPINQLGFEVVANNAAGALNGFNIQLKNTATATLPTAAGAANWETGLTTVFPAQTYTPVNGWNMFNLTGGFTWDGTSNILVEVCHNNAGFTSNASVRWTTGLAFNGSRTYRADAAGVCANPGVLANTPTSRSNIRFFRNIVAVPNCAVSPSPANGATNVIINPVLSWQAAGAGGTPTSYDVTIELVGTGIIYGPANQVGTSFNLFQGIPLPPNSTVNWTIVPINAQGPAVGCSAFTFTTGSLLGYCTSNATSTVDDDIGNVTFAGINNGVATPLTNNPTSVNTYTSFINTPAGTVEQGVSFPISVTQINSGGFFGCGVRVFFDWNQDGDFTDAGEGYAVGSTAAATQQVTANILVPLTAIPGQTTMRVVLVEGGNPATITPCGTYTWGETEDYAVNVLQTANCVAQPAAGTATSSVAIVCSGVNFNLNATGVTTGQGITYQWQSSPDNLAWTNIAGATTTIFATNQAAATYYRFVTTCNFIGQSNVTNAVFVDLDNFVNCYCASGATSTVDDDLGNVTFAGINNGVATPLQNNPASVNTYSNFTALPPASVIQGASYPFSATQINSGGFFTCGVRVFFDWNQNGLFTDPGEGYAVGTTTVPTQQVTTNIAVPPTATPGTTRMRVVLVEGGVPATISPCGTYTWGETEDYLVNVVVGVNCSGQPAAGVATASVANVCSGTSFNLNATGVTNDLGITYQWQSSPDQLAWTNIAGATATAFATTQATATYYRLVTVCTVSGLDNTTNNVFVDMTPFFACYCPYTHIGCGNGDITNVTFNTLNNTSTCSGATAVTVYPPAGPTTTDVMQFVTYPFSVTTNNGLGIGTIISVWIDWNQNGVYEATEWSQVATNNPDGTTATINILVPGTATPGQTGMRVRSRFTGNVNGATSACIAMGSGEGEDYVINVLQGTPCVDPPTAGTAASNDVLVCSAQNFNLSVTGNTVGGGQTYQWQSSPNNATWADIAGATNTAFTTNQLVATYYRLIVTCGTAVATNSVFVDMETFINCYCGSGATSTVDDDLGNVTFAGINNGVASPLLNNPTANRTYTDFTALPPAQVTQGQTYTLSATQINSGTFFTCGVRVFYDWNQDGDFVDAGEGYAIGTTTVPTQLVSAPVLVPVTATLGLTRMRVVLVEGGNPATILPCGTYTWGETEDYLVNVAAPVALDPFPAALTTPGIQSCYSNAEIVTVTIGNGGTQTIDFSVDNLTVTATVTGPGGPQTVTTTLATGTLAPNATVPVVLSGTINMSAGGTYNFSITSTMANDGNLANNTIVATRSNITAARPFYEGFAALTPPANWNTAGWFLAGIHGNGTNGLYQNLWAFNPGPLSYTLPPIGTVAAGDGFSFDYRIVNFAGYPTTGTPNAPAWGDIIVEVSTNCGQTYAPFATIDPNNHITANTWATRTYPLAAFVGQAVQFRVTVNYLAGDWYADFDNFNLTNCFPPSGVTVSGIQQTTATASWTAPGGGVLNYEWELYQGVTLVQNGTTASTTVALAGLTANTAYSFRVRSNCGADQSAFISVNFTSGRLGEDCANASDYTLTVRANEAACGGTVITSGNAQNGPGNVGCSLGSGATPDDDVWARFVAPANGNKLVVTTTGVSNFDWVMQVWTDCPANGGQIIGCNDDVNGLMPEIEICQFDYTPGATYYVRAWTWGAGGGGATMNLCVYEDTGCPAPPVNDNCANALPVPVNQPNVCGTPGALSVTGTTAFATTSATANTPCSPFSNHLDVWYRFVSQACAPNYTADFQSAPGAAVGVALYLGDNCNNFVYSGCLANANGGFLLNNLPGGTVFYLRFYSTTAATSGAFTFCMEANLPFPTNVVYVNDNAVGANTGENWYDAFTSLQSGLAAAGAGDDIYVAEGTYKPTNAADRNATFNLKAGVDLFGGFDDSGNGCDATDRDPVANVTTLSGDIGVIGTNTDNSYRVLTANNVGAIEVNGFTVTGANSNANGGGAYVLSNGAGQTSSPTFRRMTFTDNRTTNKGGAIGVLATANGSTTLVLDSCIVSNNFGYNDGGGLAMIAQTGGTIDALVDSSQFTGNQAVTLTTGTRKGGAICSWVNPGGAIDLDVVSSAFTGNTATGAGGAIWSYARSGMTFTLMVNNSTFSNNTGASGGAIYNYASGGTVNSSISNSTFTSNSANVYGSAITNYTESAGGTGNHNMAGNSFNNNVGSAFANVALKSGVGTTEASTCRFNTNSATNGGAVYMNGSGVGTSVNTSFVNSIFYNNNASNDGGAFHITGTTSAQFSTVLHSCTFHSNDANRRGGAINNQIASGASSNVTATNTIFWQNPTTITTGRSFHNLGLTASTSVNFSILDSVCLNNARGNGSFTCNTAVYANPMFLNGGTGNLALMAGSPAIDAGSMGGAPTTDYAGNTRPQGAGYDIGAYEYLIAAPRLANNGTAPAAAMDVKVFPNPTTGVFTLELGNLPTEEVFVQIFDLKGTLVSSKALLSENTAQFDLGGLSSGIYFVRIVSGDQVSTQRIVLNGRP